MWQKCPICNGTGVIIKNYSENNCKTCDGKGIISELTGLPPNGVETFASPKYRNSDGSPTTDYRDNCEQQWNK